MQFAKKYTNTVIRIAIRIAILITIRIAIRIAILITIRIAIRIAICMRFKLRYTNTKFIKAIRIRTETFLSKSLIFVQL